MAVTEKIGLDQQESLEILQLTELSAGNIHNFVPGRGVQAVSAAKSNLVTAKAVAESTPGLAYAATAADFSAPTGSVQAQPQANIELETINRKQEELARKEQDLTALQTELDGRLAEMRELEARINTMLQDASGLKDEKYKHLVDVLANMKAKQAAEVLSTLDEKIAVRILAGMRGRQAGEILSFADSAIAARLAESLARMQMPLE